MVDSGYPGHVQTVKYDLGTTPKMLTLWNSTGGGNRGSPPAAPTAIGTGVRLRTEFANAEIFHLQSCKIGRVLTGFDDPQAVVASLGGKVMLLDPNATGGPILAQSEDFGFGGAALAVHDVDGDGVDEIVFATGYDPVDGGGSDAKAKLRVLKGGRR